MKRFITISFLFSLFLLAGLSASAQDKFYLSVGTNKSENHFFSERAYSVIQLTDGSYIATGSAYIGFEFHRGCYIIKLDKQGNLVWSKKLETAGDDYGQKIIKTSDGGFAISGAINYKAALCKFDKNGNLEWH